MYNPIEAYFLFNGWWVTLSQDGLGNRNLKPIAIAVDESLPGAGHKRSGWLFKIEGRIW